MKKKLIILALITTMTATAQETLLRTFETLHNTAPFSKITTADYEPAFDRAMALHRAEVEAIAEAQAPPSFENTIEALEYSGKALTQVSTLFFALLHAEGNEAMMEIAQNISPKLAQHANDITLNEALFARVKAVYDNRHTLTLTPEQETLLTESYESMARNGANLQGEEREEYRRITTELSGLQLTFSQNVLKATNAFAFVTTDEADLVGLPEGEREAAAQLAREQDKGGYLFNLSFPSYQPFLKYSSRADLREMMYRAYNSRCITGEYSNVETMRRIAELRLRLAQLMGKATYADYVLQRRMAENAGNVYKLLNQLLDGYTPKADQEVAEVTAFASKLEGREVKLMPWDWSYYSEKLKDATYQLNDEMLKPYFELERVKQGVFGLATELYGLRFVKNTTIEVYHPEVEAFDVFDATGKYMAVLYTDFHPRSTKQQGAWMTEFKGQWRDKAGDSRPHISIVMNFTRPTADKPALLTYQEVETFLHEFGHALHGMLANTTYPTLSGTNTYRDFVELPSQFMENYMTEKAFLDKFATHYLTGETIPVDYIEKIKESANYNVGYGCVRQLTFGLLDMAWHTLPAVTFTNEEVTAFERQAIASTQLLPAVDGVMIGAQFNHIFSGGYAAGYYGYKWAEVLDADAFDVFSKHGIFDKETAASFRTNILEKGGSEPPMVLYKRFKGSEPTIDALLKRNGISVR